MVLDCPHLTIGYLVIGLLVITPTLPDPQVPVMVLRLSTPLLRNRTVLPFHEKHSFNKINFRRNLTMNILKTRLGLIVSNLFKSFFIDGSGVPRSNFLHFTQKGLSMLGEAILFRERNF